MNSYKNIPIKFEYIKPTQDFVSSIKKEASPVEIKPNNRILVENSGSILKEMEKAFHLTLFTTQELSNHFAAILKKKT